MINGYPLSRVSRKVFVVTGYVYILASKPHGTLYVGVTNDLVRRIHEHRTEAVAGFTRKYRVHTLVYFEISDSIESTIQREAHQEMGTRLEDRAYRKPEPGLGRLVPNVRALAR